MKSRENIALIIDDEPAIRDFLGVAAKNAGFAPMAVATSSEFKEAVRSVPADVIMLDLNMPGADGIELLRYLAEQQCRAHVLLISGEDSRILAAAQRLGAEQGLSMLTALQKPLRLESLERALGQLSKDEITEADLREAIDGGELMLHYQPKLSRAGNGVWAVDEAEALVRWKRREQIVMPDEFIPLAENTGLIGPLTDCVLRMGIEQLGKWKDDENAVKLAVNIPPHLLSDLAFPDRIADLLREYDVDGSQLALELTETAVMEDKRVSMDILTRLRLKGFQLSIDDFGTGYSSMKQLFHMPFSEVKIDRSFVMEMDSSAEAKIIVNAMINLAHNLQMTACAEGVESSVVLSALEGAGCDKIQGYLISKPVSAADFERLPKQWGGSLSASSGSSS